VIAVAIPSPDVILAVSVIAAVAGLWLLVLGGRQRRVARWLGGLLGAAALAGVVVKDRLDAPPAASTGIVVKPPLDIAIRAGLAWFVMATAAAAVLWLLLPGSWRRRTGRWLIGLFGGAALAHFGLAGLPSLPPAGVILAASVAASARSLWLLLPRGQERRADRWLGGLLGVAALAGFVLAGPRLGGLGEEAVFLIVSLVAVVSAAATIVARSPVYAAIWFALALAGVAGVLLVLGAQFLGVATIVVYAGAILVMFLFVLMLAQPTGMASYDRVSNEPLLSAVAGAVLLGLLSLSIGRLSAQPPDCCRMPSRATAFTAPRVDGGVCRGGSGVVDPLAADQVARLGGELFGRHLLAVEVAGVLLLVALIGSIAVVARAGDHSGELAPRRAAR
jgi:NADH-quinone oxidoreductase subunit J